MLDVHSKNFINLMENTEEKKEEPLCLLASPDESEEEKTDKALLFQGSSGRIFINIILYSVLSAGKKMKRIAHKTEQVVFWKGRDFLKAFKNADLWQYIPIRVFILSLSSGVLSFIMIYTGTFSEIVYGSGGNFEAYSAASEDIESKIIVKNIGKLTDRQLAVASSEQCDFDYKNSQNSELCGVNVKNKILIEEERREELARLAAIKAEAARKAAASRVSTGKVSCREKNDGSPSKSKTKGKHMDEDCCPDPDEWARPGCVYSPSGYALMLKGPAKKK